MKFESVIGYHFQNSMLLKQALTHSSYVNEQKINRSGDYERLEFLGDAILEMICSDMLFTQYPKLSEGELTRKRAELVCENALARRAVDFGLGAFIRLGKGEDANGGRTRKSLLADVLEAVIGAIYVDGGLEPTQTFIHKFVLSELDRKGCRSGAQRDSKTNLQEWLQREHRKPIRYSVVHSFGPDHAKVFEVEAIGSCGESLGTGTGKSKKEAEQKAASAALAKVKKEAESNLRG
ncbi:MAG: ribonuclease III [Clostridium sp.]|jgi:ribonuclease-3|nr:ribonuclease III [Clostridium sp.]